MTNEIEKFSYLWDASSSWVLVHINPEEVAEPPAYVIANTETIEALLIHDNITYRKVKKMMLEKGVKIISSWPPE
jgi:hypothetical protein